MCNYDWPEILIKVSRNLNSAGDDTNLNLIKVARNVNSAGPWFGFIKTHNYDNNGMKNEGIQHLLYIEELYICK